MKDWLFILVAGCFGLILMAWFIHGMMEIAACYRDGGVPVRAYHGLSTVCVDQVITGD
jgi:hypothetical protein